MDDELREMAETPAAGARNGAEPKETTPNAEKELERA